MLVKVCGITKVEQLQELDTMESVQCIGTIFYPLSKRYVTNLLPTTSNTHKVGVFVDEELTKIEEISIEQDLQIIQLHGNESPEYCEALSKKYRIIKAFGVSTAFDFHELIPYQKYVDFFLFDTFTPEHGGSGKKFNWKILEEYHLSTPFFLSGGIQLSDVQDLKEIEHPQFYGVDINSGFEVSPGIKNIELIKKFIDELNN
jgi:phosphoribosylanthranilate isomerase